MKKKRQIEAGIREQLRNLRNREVEFNNLKKKKQRQLEFVKNSLDKKIDSERERLKNYYSQKLKSRLKGLAESQKQRIKLHLEKEFKSDVPEEMIHAIKSHVEEWGHLGVKRESKLDYALGAAENLSGFLVACTLVQPDKKIKSVKRESVIKKLKQKNWV